MFYDFNYLLNMFIALSCCYRCSSMGNIKYIVIIQDLSFGMHGMMDFIKDLLDYLLSSYWDSYPTSTRHPFYLHFLHPFRLLFTLHSIQSDHADSMCLFNACVIELIDVRGRIDHSYSILNTVDACLFL